MHSLVWRLLCRFWYWNLLGRGQQIPDLRICNVFQRKPKGSYDILWFDNISMQHENFSTGSYDFPCNIITSMFQKEHQGKDPMIIKSKGSYDSPGDVFSLHRSRCRFNEALCLWWNGAGSFQPHGLAKKKGMILDHTAIPPFRHLPTKNSLKR